MNNNPEILNELEIIKKLLIAELIVKGVTPDAIGKTMGVTGRTIRNMVPVPELKQED
ncbi:MAG: hypothetical protein WDZ80_06780 [Candidatus Paceibacterota bacterium]